MILFPTLLARSEAMGDEVRWDNGSDNPIYKDARVDINQIFSDLEQHGTSWMIPSECQQFGADKFMAFLSLRYTPEHVKPGAIETSAGIILPHIGGASSTQS